MTADELVAIAHEALGAIPPEGPRGRLITSYESLLRLKISDLFIVACISEMTIDEVEVEGELDPGASMDDLEFEQTIVTSLLTTEEAEAILRFAETETSQQMKVLLETIERLRPNMNGEYYFEQMDGEAASFVSRYIHHNLPGVGVNPDLTIGDFPPGPVQPREGGLPQRNDNQPGGPNSGGGETPGGSGPG